MDIIKRRIQGAKRQAKYRANVRKKLMDAYGRVCVCCGEDNELFLTIDHVNNNGAEHRRGKTGFNTSNEGIYLEMIESLDSGKYQTLCYNCNCGRQRNKGICPHESDRNVVTNE